MSSYIRRAIEPTLARAAAEFPAVVLTGPRQSGKTTLLKHWAGKDYRYVSLELPDIRAAAVEDPRTFLASHAPPAIFDEIQWTPELLPYVKERIDEHRDEPGQYLLTGSQNLLLAEQVTESLAGRAAVLRLLPLSRREARSARLHTPFIWEVEEGWEAEEGLGPEPAPAPAELGASSCTAAIRSWSPTRDETSRYGNRATSRPTWSATSATFAGSAISPSSRASFAPWRPGAGNS